MFKEDVVVVFAPRRTTACELPPGLDATQVMPGQILDSLCTLYEYYALYERCRHSPRGMRSSVTRIQLYLTVLKVLLANERCKTGVSARMSMVQHTRAGNAVFASGNLEEKEETGSYYESLAYTNLG